MGGGIGRIQPLTFIGQFRFSRERERERERGGGVYEGLYRKCQYLSLKYSPFILF